MDDVARLQALESTPEVATESKLRRTSMTDFLRDSAKAVGRRFSMALPREGGDGGEGGEGGAAKAGAGRERRDSRLVHRARLSSIEAASRQDAEAGIQEEGERQYVRRDFW